MITRIELADWKRLSQEGNPLKVGPKTIEKFVVTIEVLTGVLERMFAHFDRLDKCGALTREEEPFMLQMSSTLDDYNGVQLTQVHDILTALESPTV